MKIRSCCKNHRNMVLIILLFTLLAGCTTYPEKSHQEAKATGRQAPNFTLPAADTGEKVVFPDDFKGKNVVLVFFSTG